MRGALTALEAAGCSMIGTETGTGATLKGRPELGTILDFIHRGETLVVTRIDRLARSMRDLQTIAATLKDKGAHLAATEQPVDTSTAAGKAFFDMLGVFAEFETNLRRERQAEGIAAAKQRGAYRGRLPPGSTLTSRPRFGFAAEIPLTARGADARALIVAITGHVEDALPAVVADVPLDVASTPITCRNAGSVPSGFHAVAAALRLQSIAPAPVPWRNELSSPHSAFCGFRRRLLARVRARVSTIGHRPALADQPGIDVLCAVPAHRDDAAIPVPIALLARDRFAVDPPDKRPCRLLAARPAAVPLEAGLSTLRRVQAEQSNSHRPDLDRVPVDHPSAPRDIGLNRLAPSCLDRIDPIVRGSC